MSMSRIGAGGASQAMALVAMALAANTSPNAPQRICNAKRNT
jgi:hypothetical protein